MLNFKNFKVNYHHLLFDEAKAFYEKILNTDDQDETIVQILKTFVKIHENILQFVYKKSFKVKKFFETVKQLQKI